MNLAEFRSLDFSEQSKAIGKTTQKISSPEKVKRQRKYNNQPTFVDGQRFDSKKEASRYADLKIMESSGVISGLECQPKFTFEVNGDAMTYASGRKITYSADFAYIEDGKRVVEDVKSPATAANPAYKLKKALMYWINGIDVVET